MHARLANQDDTGRSAVWLTYILGVTVGAILAVAL
jgi:hypothetical protein